MIRRQIKIIDASKIYKELGREKKITSAVHDLLFQQAKQLNREIVINKQRGR